MEFDFYDNIFESTINEDDLELLIEQGQRALCDDFYGVCIMLYDEILKDNYIDDIVVEFEYLSKEFEGRIRILADNVIEFIQQDDFCEVKKTLGKLIEELDV